ncbi:MAG: hypothetical protein U0521_13760 [Anaerolineae bacterium]
MKTMTLETLVQEIKSLPVNSDTRDGDPRSLTEEQATKRHSILEFRGVGAHLRDMDAQKHVNQLRREWDNRP